MKKQKSNKEKMIDGLLFTGQQITPAFLDAMREGRTHSRLGLELANEIITLALIDRSEYGTESCEHCTDDGEFICEKHQVKVAHDGDYKKTVIHFGLLTEIGTVCGKGQVDTWDRPSVTCQDCLDYTAKYESIFPVKVVTFKVRPSMFAY